MHEYVPNHGRLRSSVFFVLDGVFDNWDGVFGIWDNVFGLFWLSSENLSTALKLLKSTLFVALVTNMSYGLKWSICNCNGSLYLVLKQGGNCHMICGEQMLV